jgi:hypothetical protein
MMGTTQLDPVGQKSDLTYLYGGHLEHIMIGSSWSNVLAGSSRTKLDPDGID